MGRAKPKLAEKAKSLGCETSDTAVTTALFRIEGRLPLWKRDTNNSSHNWC